MEIPINTEQKTAADAKSFSVVTWKLKADVFALSLGKVGRIFALNQAVRLHWSTWSEEHVVFDETSGQTHQLDALRAFVLNAISEQTQSFDALLVQIQNAMGVDQHAEVNLLLENIIGEFQSLGLILDCVQ